VRTHGWGGAPPATDEEAISRILDAAQEGLDQHGANLKLSDVARTLNITRPTLYRYFPSTEQLLTATALRAAGPFLEDMTKRLDGVSDPADAVILTLSAVAQELPRNPYLLLVLFPDGPHSRLSELTSPLAVELGVGLLDTLAVDWESAGFDHDTRSELVELMLRMLQSWVIDPIPAQGSAEAMETYLNRWLRPSIVTIITEHRSAETRGAKRAAGRAPGRQAAAVP